MAEEALQNLKNLIAEFTDLSLNDFRDALQSLTRDKNPAIDRYLVEQLKNFRGNRTMRAEFAAALAEREDEGYIDDFAVVIEKETDVGLCKECMNGLVRIGSQESIQKLEFLANSKPNATISSLLRRELDKLRHEEKEPAAYYLDHLARGNESSRACRHAAKVLIKLGEPKAVDEILEKFQDYDDLARAEGAKVVSQLGQPRHQKTALAYLDQHHREYRRNRAFVDTLEAMEQEPKEKRVGIMTHNAKQLLTAEQEPYFEQFLKALEAHNAELSEIAMNEALDIEPRPETAFYMKSLLLIASNKVAHAQQFFEEQLRSLRTRHSRLRHLAAQLAYAVGKIGGQEGIAAEERTQAIQWLEKLVVADDPDISKMALYGASFVVHPEDTGLLDATLRATQLEGMTRLISALGRKSSAFADFFLKIAMRHEILDIQEMAMAALGEASEVYDRVREMLNDEAPEVRLTAIRIIAEIKAVEFLEDLSALLSGQSDIIRVGAIGALGKLGQNESLSLIKNAMADAKSPLLVETGLQAIADIGGPEAIESLHEFSKTTRQRKAAITAIRLLVESYRSWRSPLPSESSAMTLEHLKTWFEERDAAVRTEAYHIAGMLVTADTELYEALKGLFKEASSRLRAQAVWDKEEMAEVDGAVRALNRNFFFLKEMLDFQKAVSSQCKSAHTPKSTQRTAAIEKLIEFLDHHAKFTLSAQNEEELETLVLFALEEGAASWREQDLAYQVAGWTESEKLRDLLSGRVKTAPIQAKASLLEALAKFGMSLERINQLTAIRTVLVIEGSGFFRKRLVKYLKDESFEVRDADTLELAHAAIQQAVPDLVITELTFKAPCDGVDFVERLAKEQAGIQIIISTNARDTAVLERLSRLKPRRLLHKPYPLEELTQAIRS